MLSAIKNHHNLNPSACCCTEALRYFFLQRSWMVGNNYPYLPRSFGIPNDNVSIRTDSNSPLLWVKVKNFCCICAGNSYKSVFIHFSTVLHKSTKKQTHYFLIQGMKQMFLLLKRVGRVTDLCQRHINIFF